jgi:hypothetical protein
MIIWSNGTDTGAPRYNFPEEVDEYEINVYTYGTFQLWCTEVKKYSFRIVTDHFKTKEEAYDFLDVVVNILTVKYPNAVCSNFSFLTKQE